MREEKMFSKKILLTISTLSITNLSVLYASELSPTVLIIGETLANRETSATAFQRHLENYSKTTPVDQLKRVKDIAKLPYSEAKNWAKEINDHNICTSPSLEQVLAKTILGANLCNDPYYYDIHTYNWGLIARTLYHAKMSYNFPATDLINAKHFKIFTTKLSEQEVNEVRNRIKKGLTQRPIDMKEMGFSRALLPGYINQTVDVDFFKEIWNATPEDFYREQYLKILSETSQPELRKLAVELAIDYLDKGKNFYIPSIIYPQNLDQRTTQTSKLDGIKILAENLDIEPARQFIFQKLDANPFYFYPYEKFIFEGLKNVKLHDHEIMFLDDLKKVTNRYNESLSEITTNFRK